MDLEHRWAVGVMVALVRNLHKDLGTYVPDYVEEP